MLAASPVSAHEMEPGDHTPTAPVPAEFAQGFNRVASTDSYGTINSDLAFWGNLAVMGTYNGPQLIDISNPASPVVLADYHCHGSQNDVSIWGSLLFMSVDRPQTSPDCESEPTAGFAPGWEGIRVLDISDPAHPALLASVATDCGSHTHTLVPDVANGRVLIYVSSYSSNSDTFGLTPWGNDCQVGHSYISVVEVSLASPAQAHVVSKPALPLDAYFASGGNGCHDIGVFVSRKMAAAACSGNALLLDLTDPVNPMATDRIGLPHAKAFWHSGAFSWDGTVAIFGDETFGGGGNSCKRDNNQDNEQGRLHFYRIDPGTKRFVSTTEVGSYKLSRLQTGSHNVGCTAHNYNVLPVAGRNVLNSSWYVGGTTLVDFTDPARPVELAYFDYANVRGYSGAWSSYFYNGYSYATSIETGLDVLRYSGPLAVAAQTHLNPQTQE